MVAVIHTSSSLTRAFHYNEEKVKAGQASCILAANYPMDCHELSLSNKLNRLTRQASLNENVTRNSVHISLNFHPSEKLDNTTYADIAQVYMDKIGFGDQPYLVYRHEDAGHPHIHIVSVKVRADGSRIDMHNIGKKQSALARKEIEKAFGLIKATDAKKTEAFTLQPVNAWKVQYGKTATKRAITSVLDMVIHHYRYTSLPELNAVLRLYNVLADRGNTTSRIYQSGGLVYRVLDADGHTIGVPIKASDIYSKPTLKLLEKKIIDNDAARQAFKKRITGAVDWLLLKDSQQGLPKLIASLQKEQIHLVIRQNEQGIAYGITFIDHRTQCVFNGSDLGKAYSAKGLLERCHHKQETLPATFIQWQRTPRHVKASVSAASISQANALPIQPEETLLDDLLAPIDSFSYIPAALKKKKKKRHK